MSESVSGEAEQQVIRGAEVETTQQRDSSPAASPEYLNGHSETVFPAELAGVTGSDDSPPLKPFPTVLTHPEMVAVQRSNWRRQLALTGAALVGLYFLWRVQSILLPFLIAFFFAALLDPTVRYFQAHGYSRVRAILTLYLSFLTFIGLIIVFVIPLAENQVTDLSVNFSAYYENVYKTIDLKMRENERLLTLFGLKHRLDDILKQKSGPVQASINSVLGGLTGFLQDAASKVIWLVIIPVATFFLMRDYPLLRARFIALFPEDYQEQAELMSRNILDVFSAYIRGLAKICFLYALWAIVLFKLLGVSYWLFLGLMAGMFYAVPYVGQLFTAVASSAIAYSMPAHSAFFFLHVPANSTSFALTVVLACVLSQVLFDQIIYPRVVGQSVGLHPVVSIFALMAGATLMGVWGMLLAVPVAASVQIVLTHFFPRLTKPLPPRLLEASRKF